MSVAQIIVDIFQTLAILAIIIGDYIGNEMNQ